MSKVVPLKQPPGYRVANKGTDRAEIYLYGPIGESYHESVSASRFKNDLKKLGDVKHIDLRINSDGGSVTDARAMHTLLMAHPAKIVVHIDGIAASAASFLAMAGDEIRIAEGAFVMIHNARMMAYGEAKDFRHAATVLEVANDTIRATYVKRTGAKPEDVTRWMDAETWWSGPEAVKHGFADKIVEDMQIAACLHDASKFKNLPASLRPKRAKAQAALANMKAPLR